MPTGTLISVEEYLGTSYRPDCDYVDGQVMERNLGERSHGRLQLLLGAYFLARQAQWKIYVMLETRLQVTPSRFRVPDLCVTLGPTEEQILTKPPFLCVEIVSPEDRMTRLHERVREYTDMGVPYVWILDPLTRSAYVVTRADGLREIKSGILVTENPALEVPLSEIFES